MNSGKIIFRSVIVVIVCLAFGTCSKKQDEQKTDDVVLADSAEQPIVQPVKINLPDTTPVEFHKVAISHPRGDAFDLFLPKGFKIRIVANGLKRARFMDKSPDGRLFLTDMNSLADNKKGAILILGDADNMGMFQSVTPYLEKLRNPNSLAFHTDRAGKTWLYLALTDRLLRYPYAAGDTVPSGEPQILDTYPDYGLSYRYGGWHLTRTIQFGGNGKLYISVGSSCNTCVEKEEVRASIIEMDEDGKNRRIFARGLRNAVGMAWADGKLYATNMAADHLGKDKPDDYMVRVEEGNNFGWPYCYYWQGSVYNDPKWDSVENRVMAKDVPGAFSYFGAHTAPLGLAWFGEDNATDPALAGYFIVAQHGSYSASIGNGYSLQRVRENHAPEDFVKGFLDAEGNVHGRPCGVFPDGVNSFYFTDDKFGTVYQVYKE